MAPRRLTRELLTQAARATKTWDDAVRWCGGVPTRGSRRHLRSRMAAEGIDTSHFPSNRVRHSEATLRRLAAESTSVAEVVRRLGISPVGGNQAHIGRRIRALGIDTSHFARGPRKRGNRPPKERLVLSSAAAGRTPGEALRRWLLLSGRPETCAMCGTAGEWNGRPLRLQVDHRDGHWWDNRPENLRLLCPNCHAVTDTFRGRRRSGSTERRPPLARAALAEAVSDAGSMVELLRILRVPDSEAARARVRRDIATHGLDASHFAGQGTHRGRSRARLSAKAILSPSRPGTPRRKTYMLRRALSELGVEAVCVMCGLGDRWRGRRLVLEIDHINGDRLDNRIENLRYLCPSCHTQTVTYGGNKTPRRSKAAVAPQHRPARRRAAAPAVPRPRKPEPTEEERAELKAAVADSAGWADLVRRLGLRASTGRRRTLQKRVADLGLDTSHFKQRSAWRTYADDSIAEAVASSESMREVIDKLCVRISVGALAHIARRIEAMGIDTSHLADLRDGAQELPFTREELRSVADSRRSVREVARRLGISDDTRSRKALGRMLEKHGLAP